MKYFLDLSLAVIILATVITCWHRGLIRSIFGALKTVLAAILTYMIAPHVSTYLLDRLFSDRVHHFVCTRLVAMFEEGTESFDLALALQKLPESIKILLNNFHVDVDALIEKYGAMGNAGNEELMELASSISTPVASFLASAIGYTLTFAAASLVLSIVAWGLSRIADLPLIKRCDRFLGLVLGIIGAAFYSALYVVIVYALLSWLEAAYGTVPFTQGFEQTYIFRPLYDYNIFRIIFGF